MYCVVIKGENMKKKVCNIGVLIIAFLLLVGCEKNSSVEEVTSVVSEESSTEESEHNESQSIDIDALIGEVTDALENSTEVEEITTDKDAQFYYNLMGSSVKGKVLLVKTEDNDQYEAYEQHVCVNDDVYYTIHHEFYKDAASYQEQVEYLTKQNGSLSVYIPLMFVNNALYVKYMDRGEYYGIHGSYEAAVNNTEIRVGTGRNIKIIVDY